MRNRLFAPSAARTARRRKGLFAGRPWGRLWRVCFRPSGRNACASFFLCPFLPDLAAGRCSSPPEGSGVRCPRLPQKVVRAPSFRGGRFPCAAVLPSLRLCPAFLMPSSRFSRAFAPFSPQKMPLFIAKNPPCPVANSLLPCCKKEDACAPTSFQVLGGASRGFERTTQGLECATPSSVCSCAARERHYLQALVREGVTVWANRGPMAADPCTREWRRPFTDGSSVRQS